MREASSARLHVDANAGWTREKAVDLIPRLKEFGIEFVEQPLPIGDIEGLRWLHAQKLGLPIFADENILTSQDVAAHAGIVEGVVVKLSKTSGIREALRAIHTARALDMQVMIGSMVETTLAITAAAHLSPLCDYADLDGPLLLSNDPFCGRGLRRRASDPARPTRTRRQKKELGYSANFNNSSRRVKTISAQARAIAALTAGSTCARNSLEDN